MASRDNSGRFEKGSSGNPKGRPRKTPPVISDEQLRQDFFDAAEALVAIVEGGRRKLIPARLAIEKQLTLKAASGDMKAICEYNKRRDRFTLEHVKLQLANWDAILKAEDRIQKFPEDVTDEVKRVLMLLYAKLDPHFRLF